MLSNSMRLLTSVTAASQRVLLMRTFATAGRVQGTVKWFDRKKGFGFINTGSTAEDVFVHQSQIQSDGFRTLVDGEAVEFEIGQDQARGKKVAMRVTGPDNAVLSVTRLPRRETGQNEGV
eukprot:gene36838-44688_t